MKRTIDRVDTLIGRTFGRLTCTARVGTNAQGDATWLFTCTCGAHVELARPRVRAALWPACPACADAARTRFKAARLALRNLAATETEVPARWTGGTDGVRRLLIELGEPPEDVHTLVCADGEWRWGPPAPAPRHRRTVTEEPSANVGPSTNVGPSAGKAPIEDLIGRTFGRLTVVDRLGADHQLCRCSCGGLRAATADELFKGAVADCGCSTGTPAPRALDKAFRNEWSSFNAAKQRCTNPQATGYARYGGRGVTVCPEWLARGGFKRFLEALGPCPPGHTLDRVDGDGDYCPTNCRWANRRTQRLNRPDVRTLTLFGRTQRLVDWVAELGVAREQLLHRAAQGFPDEVVAYRGNLRTKAGRAFLKAHGAPTTPTGGKQSTKGRRVQVGEVFDQLTVTADEGGGRLRCRCTCGRVEVVSAQSLKRGKRCRCSVCTRRARFADLVGRTFGRLTVRELVPDGRGGFAWRCTCTCGGEVLASTQALTTGQRRSCGCLHPGQRPVCSKATRTTFVDMHLRCEDPRTHGYANYGGRGIKVCARWSGKAGLRNFVADVGPRPAGCTLDRIDVDGDYCPENCRWATPKEQRANRRDRRERR